MYPASALDSASRYRSENGGGWSSVGGSCGKIWPMIPYLLFTASSVRIDWFLPGKSTPARSPCWRGRWDCPKGIMAYPSLPKWRFPTTVDGTAMTTKKTTKNQEGTSLLKSQDNQTHNKITEYRVGSGDLIAMATVTKKHLHFQNTWGSVYRKLFIVKWI